MTPNSRSLPGICRIRSKKDFEYLREGSKKIVALPLVFYFKPSRVCAPFARLGMSVSSKHGNAIKRNRIKRLLREEFRLCQLRHTLGVDILVVLARPSINETQLRTLFRNLLEQAKF